LTDHKLSAHSAVDKTTMPCRNLLPNDVSQLLISLNRGILTITIFSLHLIQVLNQLIKQVIPGEEACEFILMLIGQNNCNASV